MLGRSQPELLESRRDLSNGCFSRGISHRPGLDERVEGRGLCGARLAWNLTGSGDVCHATVGCVASNGGIMLINLGLCLGGGVAV